MLRYNLRSSKKPTSRHSRNQNTKMRHKQSVNEPVVEPVKKKAKPTISIYSLPPEMIFHICEYLEPQNCLAFYRTCRYFKDLLDEYDLFWKHLCKLEDLVNYETTLKDNGNQDKLSYSGQPIRVPVTDMVEWKKVFRRGIYMRRNILDCNYEGWRIYANNEVPIFKFDAKNDLLDVKKQMGEISKLSSNDDIKIDWDEKHLVIFHFFRNTTEKTRIWVFDIENEPKFLYTVEKGTDYVTDKVFVHKGHVVIVPSWPITASALVMTLSIEDNMNIVGKYIFEAWEKKNQIDLLWMNTVIRVVKDFDKVLVVCRSPAWECLILDIPSCNLLKAIDLGVANTAECQQIRSNGMTIIVLFAPDDQESDKILATIELNDEMSCLKPLHKCTDVIDVALFPGTDVIYLLKKSGDVLTYDSNTNLAKMKIPNNLQEGSSSNCEFQMFVNSNEEICLLQSAQEAECGRHITVYDDSAKEIFKINLDLWKYGLSRDESLCIYANGAFLCVANSQKLLLFHVKTGKYLSQIPIPIHMERSKGKENADCMFDPPGLNLLIFDEDKLITVHDYERTFPSVLDIYRFW